MFIKSYKIIYKYVKQYKIICFFFFKGNRSISGTHWNIYSWAFLPKKLTAKSC